MSDSVTRTVRFKKEEIKKVEEFLRQNPFFDFSSLVRTSLDAFMANPTLKIRAVKTRASTEERPQ